MAILQPPAHFADPLSGDMAATLSFLAARASELVAFRAECLALALPKDMASNLSSIALVKRFAGKAYAAMGKFFHVALMEWLQVYTGIEDTAVPRLLLIGMPITGDALESPFLLPDPQAPTWAPARRVWLQQRALSFKDAHVPSL
eukprot:6492206-Amphidinium_carterae.3